jgi:hypothetical protein
VAGDEGEVSGYSFSVGFGFSMWPALLNALSFPHTLSSIMEPAMCAEK